MICSERLLFDEFDEEFVGLIGVELDDDELDDDELDDDGPGSFPCDEESESGESVFNRLDLLRLLV